MMAAAKRDIKPTGYTDKQVVRIMTVDKERNRVECAMRDGAMVYAAIWESPVIFRWPKTGEIWTIRKDTGIWRLGNQVEGSSTINESSATPISDLNEGETRILGDTVHVNNITGNEAWQTPALLNSWLQYPGGAFSQIAYRKDVIGRVSLRGLVTKATGASTTTILTLPEGYRPIDHVMFAVPDGLSSLGGSVSRVDVQSDGNVIYRGGNSTVIYLALDVIGFWTD